MGGGGGVMKRGGGGLFALAAKRVVFFLPQQGLLDKSQLMGGWSLSSRSMRQTKQLVDHSGSNYSIFPFSIRNSRRVFYLRGHDLRSAALDDVEILRLPKGRSLHLRGVCFRPAIVLPSSHREERGRASCHPTQICSLM